MRCVARPATAPRRWRRQRPYNLIVVLLDLAIPGLSGYEVARRLRRRAGPEQVLLIAVTGFGDDRHRRQADEAGFDFYLVKPVDLVTLTTLLEVGRAAAARAPREGSSSSPAAGPPTAGPEPASPELSGPSGSMTSSASHLPRCD